MRGFAVVLVCLCVFAPRAKGADPTFPYTAKVAVDAVDVRCGPGWEYYTTGRLRRGEEVQVYRHEPGGWLAIRPPKGSYSWISARHASLTDDSHLAKCAIDGAVAWVGASSGNIRQHKWQVRLERDELVEVLGQQPLSVGPGFATETYYRIAPPAGEFRWIHAQNAVAPGSIARRSTSRTIQLTEFSKDARATDLADTQSATGASTGTASAVVGNDRKLTDDQRKELSKRLDQLNIELSLLVTREITQWDLSALKRRAGELAEATAGTPLARNVRAVTLRIREFATLQRRFERMSEKSEKKFPVDEEIEPHGVSAAPRTLQSLWQGGGDAVGTGVDLASAESAASPFAAEGWLMPVHSTKRVAPPFAVLDDNGRVRCYVTPQPGLNLRRYVKKYVGLIGERRYATALRAPHVTVSRVVKQKKTR